GRRTRRRVTARGAVVAPPCSDEVMLGHVVVGPGAATGPPLAAPGGGSVRFRVERGVLAEAVAWTARSLPARPPVPVLAGLLVEAGPDGLTLSGFDYEVSTRVTVDADVLEGGRVLVSGRLLADISRSL